MSWLCWAGRVGSLTLLLVGVAPGCGGKSHADNDRPAAGGSAAAAGSAPAAGNAPAGGGSTAGAGVTAGSAGESTLSPEFVPDAAPAYNDENALGSFEENQGYGWDTCHTRTPERLSRQSGASEGSKYMSFQSDDNSLPTGSPDENASASQLYFWFEQATEVSDNLYFDAKSLGGASATGVLRFYGTDRTCESEKLLLEVALDQLELQSDWAVRCVTLTGLRAQQGLGIAVTGGVHSIGLDAFRFGPPCRTNH